MKGMLKAELFKFFHSYSLWVIIGVLVVCSSISIITGTYSNAEAALMSLSKDSMVPILACAVYSSIILTDDFSNGLLRHYISNGYTRTSVISAKFIHYILGCSILLLVYPMVCVSLAAILHGVETSFVFVIKTLLLTFIRTLPLYWGIFSLYFLFSIWIQKGVIAMGVSLASSILIVVFTNKFYGGGTNILKYTPVIQINETAQRTTDEYFISVVISLVILTLCFLGSIIKFRHEEL